MVRKNTILTFIDGSSLSKVTNSFFEVIKRHVYFTALDQGFSVLRVEFERLVEAAEGSFVVFQLA